MPVYLKLRQFINKRSLFKEFLKDAPEKKSDLRKQVSDTGNSNELKKIIKKVTERSMPGLSCHWTWGGGKDLPCWGRTVGPHLSPAGPGPQLEQPSHPGSCPPGQPQKVKSELGIWAQLQSIRLGWPRRGQASMIVLPVPMVTGVLPVPAPPVTGVHP